MSKALFQITPLNCPGCGKQMEDKLLKQGEIIAVKVFPGLGRIRMEFDETKINAEYLEGLIGSCGYDVELKSLR